MSYRLIDSNAIANKSPEVNDMPCVYADLPNGLDGSFITQQWIPVTERLPKPNEENELGFLKAYLVQDGRWMDVARWDGTYWIAWGYGMVLNNVTAWMPLPEPYKE